MKSSKRKGELVFLFLLLFILSLLVTQIVMVIRQSHTVTDEANTSQTAATDVLVD